jgi:hypothetical protein
MTNSSGEQFKKGLDKAFSNVKLNSDTMLDLMSAKQGVKEEDDMSEEWSEKYKKSIDCSHPKGFSQRAHCQGRKKKQKSETKEVKDLNLSDDNKDMVHGIVDILNQVKDIKNKEKIAQNMIKQFKKENIKVDTNDFLKMCNLDTKKKTENKEATGSGSSGAYSAPVFGGDDAFWDRSRKETPELKESDVEKVEATEATGSGSVGGYSSPAMWAKSTKKKDWGPSRKTQVPGGKFVSVKKKCTKFPYCNQGDINALNISKNESVAEAIKNVSKKMNVSENVIKAILEHEYEKLSKRDK